MAEKRKKVCVYIDPEKHKEWRHIAVDKGVSLGTLIEETLTQAFAKEVKTKEKKTA